jgi:hypothetical protein
MVAVTEGYISMYESLQLRRNSNSYAELSEGLEKLLKEKDALKNASNNKNKN